MKKQLLAALLFGGVTGMLFGLEPLLFDRTQWKPVNLKHPGSETVQVTSAPLGDTGRTVPVLAWGTPRPPVVELALQGRTPKLEKFERAEFILTLNAPEALPLRRIVLRLADRSGETFQFAPDKAGGLVQGRNELRYTVDAAAPKGSIWGGDGNKKIDWPLRVAGIAIDMNRETPGDRRILLDSLECRPSGEHAAISLRTGHRLNLLLPERKTPPELVIRNTGLEPLELTGTLTISDAGDGIRTEPVSCRIAPGGEAMLPLPGDYMQQGWWKVDYRLKGASGKEFAGTHRFARMNPAGPTPERAQEFLFGLCGHPERFSPEEAELEALAAGLCGAKILRTDFAWGRIQPQRDRWNFSVYDRLVDVFGRNGVELQCLLGYSVPWAVPASYKPKNPEVKGRPGLPDYDDFAKFAGTVADRYKDRIRYFEIWNEPDLIGFANFSAESYMELLRRGYGAVKKAAPEAKVMNGGIAAVHTNNSGRPNHNNGLFELLLADGGKHFDLFAFHGHGAFKPYVGQLRELRKYGLTGPGAPRPWYSNETAESSAAIGERKQAASVFKKLLYAWANGAMGYNWYLLREKSYYPLGHHERHFGLITAEFEPKPAYVTYNMLANTYKGGKFLRTVDLAPGVYGCLFENPTGQGLLALWNEGTARTVLLAGLPAGTTRIDLFGNEQPLPVRDGMAYLRISEQPFTLWMPEVPEEKIRIGGEVLTGRLPQQLAVPSGGTGELALQLANPLSRPLALEIRAAAPEHLTVAPAAHAVTLPAKGDATVRLRLTADREFKATPTAPALFRFSVTPAGLSPETITLPVVNRLPEGEPLFRLGKAEQYHSFVESAPGNEPLYWKGPEDLGANVFLSCEGKHLLLRAEVRDDVHVQPYRGSDVWQGDGIQFALRLPGQDKLWKFGLTRLADGKPEVYCWSRPAGFSGTVSSIRLETARDEVKKTTVYRAEIPFRAIGMTPENAANGFRFNLIVNDNDGNLREGFLAAAPGLGVGDDEAAWPIVNLR